MNTAKSLAAMPAIRSAEEALAFVAEHGVVLLSAKGPAPRLTEAIVGESIKGSWWAHPRSRFIYGIVSEVTEAKEILVCRLVSGRITLVHRRLWPSLVRLAKRFAPEQLAQVMEEHTASGRHIAHSVPFPRWVPAEVLKQANTVPEEEALRALGRWLPPPRRTEHAA